MLSISVFSVVYFNKDVADWWAAQQVWITLIDVQPAPLILSVTLLDDHRFAHAVVHHEGFVALNQGRQHIGPVVDIKKPHAAALQFTVFEEQE
jgi:hypothetical protein